MKDIARERIKILLDLAKKRVNDRPDLSDRYVYIARRIAMKARVKMPPRVYCRKCGTFWYPGKTVTVRVENGYLIYKCMKCGYTRKLRLK
ncbi:ribonuclease P [Nanoarchaeota archaeon]|nr:MAG: ribonuclease P [Nanoarchaeota archaeon]